MNIRKITVYLHSADMLVIGFAAILSVINLIFAGRIPYWWKLITLNCSISILICLLAYVRHVTGSTILRYIHDWYVAPVTFLSFKELYFMIKPIHFG
ncbi:MAG: hypothetical protein HY708_04085, partial [Ignavibacteriae bacterium]|nr:hypothetical protein [Ignavibacteriota bacterium]